MKRVNLLLVSVFMFCACTKIEVRADNGQGLLAGITPENYPRVDGSTSTRPVNMLIACKLLEIPYCWAPGILEWSIGPDWNKIPSSEQQQWIDFFREQGPIQLSQTHGAFMNLIDGNADIILTHRTISPDERAHAEEVGVTLVETSVAMDAFVFVVNSNNPVRSLTADQVRDIYTGRITNWKQVGGNDEIIIPYTRPRNSGSEEIMRSLVMQGQQTADLPEIEQISSMAGVFPEIKNKPNSICYTFKYYKEMQVRTPDETVPSIAINGIFPDETSVKNRTYPFIPEVHVAIRSDLDRNSTAYKMYEWLQTEAGQRAIAESGYIPLETPENSMEAAGAADIRIYPNPVTEGFYVTGLIHPVPLTLFDVSGRLMFSGQAANNEYIQIESLPKGVYIAVFSTDKGSRQVKIIKK